MANPVNLTVKNDLDGKFIAGSVAGSVSQNVLNTANDATSPIAGEGYQNHDYQYEVASIGTNVTVALQVQLAENGVWVTRATKQSTANGNESISYTGYAFATRILLQTITAGSPVIRNIAGVSSNPYKR